MPLVTRAVNSSCPFKPFDCRISFWYHDDHRASLRFSFLSFHCVYTVVGNSHLFPSPLLPASSPNETGANGETFVILTSLVILVDIADSVNKILFEVYDSCCVSARSLAGHSSTLSKQSQSSTGTHISS